MDWSKGAGGLKYNQAVANTRLVGAQVGLLLKALEKDKQISPSKVHIVGLSLGAHVAGYAGKAVPGVARISGIHV